MKTTLTQENNTQSKSIANNVGSSIFVQAKLKVGSPDDKFEQEADQTAERVMSMKEPSIQRQNGTKEEKETIQQKQIIQRENDEEEPIQTKLSNIGHIEEREEIIHRFSERVMHKEKNEEEEPVQKKRIDFKLEKEENEQVLPKSFLQKKENEDVTEHAKLSRIDDELNPGRRQEGFLQKKETPKEKEKEYGDAGDQLDHDIQSSRGNGAPLPDSTLSFMESRIGADFSGVRIHDNTQSASLSRQLNAQAFTTGKDIFFNSGKYRPETSSGKHLLAHELTHVVQQGATIKRKSSETVPHDKEFGNATQMSYSNTNSSIVQRNIIDNVTGGVNAVGNAVSDLITSVSQTIGSGITAATSWIRNIAGHIGASLVQAWVWIRQIASRIGLGVQAAWNWLREIAPQFGFTSIVRLVSFLFGAAGSVAMSILSFYQFIRQAASQMGVILSSAWDLLRSISRQIGMGITLALNWVRTLAGRIGAGFIAAWNWAVNLSRIIGRAIRQAVDWLISVAMQIAMGLSVALNWLQNLARQVRMVIIEAFNWIRNIANQIRLGIIQALNFIINLARAIGNAIITFAWNWIVAVARMARMAIIQVFSFLRNVVLRIGGMINRAWNWIVSVARRLGRMVVDAWNWVVNQARRLAMAILQFWTWIVNLAKRLAKSISDAIDWWWNAPGITHETLVEAADGSSNSRNDIGVGEVVIFTGTKTGKWTANGGSPVLQATGTGFTWTAPNRAATVKISLESGKYTNHVNINVLEPNSITARKIRELNYPSGEQGAGMKLDFNYHPKKVSFSNLMAREVSGPASNIEGYYRDDGSAHYHNSGDTFFNIDRDNSLEPDVQDTAAQSGYPSPWYAGSFRWIIPNKFKVKTESGDGKEFTKVTQAFNMVDSSGRTTITKAGEEVDRTP